MVIDLKTLYGAEATEQQKRYEELSAYFAEEFGDANALSYFSAPGRTEVGGNHTDHNNGKVLAAAVNLDVIAAVKKTENGVIRLKSVGFPMDTVDTADLNVQEAEKERSASLIRGVCARLKALGYEVGGFDAVASRYGAKIQGADEGSRIRRRRECLSCMKRFTTYEIIESLPIIVVKKDKSREAFDRNKLLNGLLRACEKRPVSYQMLEDAVDNIEQALLNSYEREITSIHVGELAMQELKNIDEVAYVRFASVYRQFGDINTFMDELKDLLNKRATQGRDTASEDAEK